MYISLALVRLETNLTQAAVAHELGVSHTPYHKWETGKCNPRYPEQATKSLRRLFSIKESTVALFPRD